MAFKRKNFAIINFCEYVPGDEGTVLFTENGV